MSIDLQHIAGAVDHSLARGRALALAYNDVDGYPSVSYRGSTHVLSATELGVWTRNPNDGLAKGVSANPDVSLALFDPETSPFMLSIRGTARVDASQNDRVYDAMIQGERDYDPDKGGVAIIIEVTSVRRGGPFAFPWPHNDNWPPCPEAGRPVNRASVRTRSRGAGSSSL